MGILRYSYLVLLSWIVTSFCFCASLSEDGRALLDFLHAFEESSPAYQRLNRSWDASAPDPCAWEGVSCSPSSLRVLALSLPAIAGPPAPLSPSLASLTHLQNLSLPSLNLSGPIPLALTANCRFLRSLNLSGNSLSGPIPSSLFTGLANLFEVALQSNQLSGTIPPGIGLCKTLTLLTIQDNLLSGTIPAEIGQLSLLRVFRAGGNARLSGSLPPELGNCSSLVEFGVAFTGISGSIPRELGHLSNLQILKVYTTNLSGKIPPELGNCTQLEQLHLYANKLFGSIPGELGKLKKLQRLTLWHNKLSDTIPPELGMLENMETFDVSENQLTGSIPASFGQLRKLTELYISTNNLSGEIPSELGNCSNMIILQLDRNNLSGRIPGELGKLSNLTLLYLWINSLEGSPPNLSNCTKLVYLDLSVNMLEGSLEFSMLPSLKEILLIGNRFSGEIPSAIAGCKNLLRLRLGQNMLTGSIPEELGNLQSLTYLDISNNQISGTIPDSISGCKVLELFDAHNNCLKSPIPANLSQLADLQALDLSFNLLTGLLPSALGGLGNLTTLIVSSNFLSGQVPSDLGNLKKLTYLDLSSNCLSGTIPSSLGQISALNVAVNMCCNSLSGPVPDGFTQMLALEALDISHNKLYGNLDVFGKIRSLLSLNISYNLFTGHLPDTLLFTSMSKSNYAGNPDLCKPSCFASNMSADGGSRNGSILRRRAVNGFLFGAVGLIFAIGCFMLWSVIRSSIAYKHKQNNIIWPWVLTPFQKISFTAQDILDRLVESNIIGKGCSGVVYKAVMPEGEVIAVKQVAMATSSSKVLPMRNFFKTEMETLRAIRHKNIVRLLGFCTNHESSLLLYDYMPNGSLEECMHKKKRMLDWDTRYNIALGAAQGLAYLHHDCLPPILHRDVKASNILLGAHLEPYLADFGLAKIVVNASCATQTVLAGSYGYIAPEYAYSLSITEKSDVYSYGVVVLEILTGKRPVDSNLGEGRHLIDWVHEMHHISDDVVDILDPCLRGMADPYMKEMLQTLTLALECVHPLPSERPSMRHVVTLLLHIRHSHVYDFTKMSFGSSSTMSQPSFYLPTNFHHNSYHTHTSSFPSPHTSHNHSSNPDLMHSK